jgi:hypothetical protein
MGRSVKRNSRRFEIFIFLRPHQNSDQDFLLKVTYYFSNLEGSVAYRGITHLHEALEESGLESADRLKILTKEARLTEGTGSSK